MDRQKQLKKRMYSLIRVILLILVLLTGTTLAWFTYTGNSSVNITPSDNRKPGVAFGGGAPPFFKST